MTTLVAPMRLVLIDLTTSVTPDALRPSAILNAYIVSQLAQINEDYAPYYGAPPLAMRIGSLADRDPAEIALNFRDTLSQPDALADHSVTNGVPDIECGCDLFSSLSTGNESLTQGASHEVLEMLNDRGANGWKDKQDGSGKTEAEETADPVQNTFYTKQGLDLSNFVLPAYFIPGAVGPWDFLGVMTSQQDITHGYAIRASAPVDAAVVQGEEALPPVLAALPQRRIELHGAEKLTEMQRKRKQSPYSRSYRRGVRL